MSIVRFISDLHLGHESVARHRGMTSDYHDNLIIENWNSIVKKSDTTYILGDVCMHSRKIPEYISKLSGTIVVIGGNHDTKNSCRILSSMGIPVLGCMSYKGFILTHIPVVGSELLKSGRYIGNIHGHTHKSLLGIPYYNVCCENINYTPISLNDLLDLQSDYL